MDHTNSRLVPQPYPNELLIQEWQRINLLSAVPDIRERRRFDLDEEDLVLEFLMQPDPDTNSMNSPGLSPNMTDRVLVNIGGGLQPHGRRLHH